jgi:glycosyltransferase involved in cell wall biosynthesis
VPVSLLEAASCGVPFVAARVGGIPEVAGDNAMLCQPGDPDRFTESVSSLIRDPGLREGIGAENRKLALERYGLRAWGDRIEQIYRELAGKTGSSG